MMSGSAAVNMANDSLRNINAIIGTAGPRINSFRSMGEHGGPRQIKHYSLPFKDEGPKAALGRGGAMRLFWELCEIETYD